MSNYYSVCYVHRKWICINFLRLFDPHQGFLTVNGSASSVCTTNSHHLRRSTTWACRELSAQNSSKLLVPHWSRRLGQQTARVQMFSKIPRIHQERTTTTIPWRQPSSRSSILPKISLSKLPFKMKTRKENGNDSKA